jgi:hypothetical protein
VQPTHIAGFPEAHVPATQALPLHVIVVKVSTPLVAGFVNAAMISSRGSAVSRLPEQISALDEILSVGEPVEAKISLIGVIAISLE